MLTSPVPVMCCLTVLAMLLRGSRPPPAPGVIGSSRYLRAGGLRRETPPVETCSLRHPSIRGEAFPPKQTQDPTVWSGPAYACSL
jgi:hypothetical protein